MIKIQDLKKGDVVWECEAGMNLCCTIIEDPVHIDEPHAEGWSVKALNHKNEEFTMFASDVAPHYGPRLYPEPMYGTFDRVDKVKQVIVMRTKYPDGKGGTRKLRTGKMIAQGSHASMAWLTNRFRDDLVIDNDNPKEVVVGYRTWRTTPFSLEEQAWITEKFTKVTVYVETEEELRDLHTKAVNAGLTSYLIQDAGDTEFGGVPTFTALGIGPHSSSKIDPITGHLPLL